MTGDLLTHDPTSDDGKGNGGGILNQGRLTIEDTLLTRNVARDGHGGAIDNLGPTTIENSKLVENWAGVWGRGHPQQRWPEGHGHHLRQ